MLQSAWPKVQLGPAESFICAKVEEKNTGPLRHSGPVFHTFLTYAAFLSDFPFAFALLENKSIIC